MVQVFVVFLNSTICIAFFYINMSSEWQCVPSAARGRIYTPLNLRTWKTNDTSKCFSLAKYFTHKYWPL